MIQNSTGLNDAIIRLDSYEAQTEKDHLAMADAAKKEESGLMNPFRE